MLAILASAGSPVGELAAPFDMCFAGASKHVKVLEKAGLSVATSAAAPTSAASSPARSPTPAMDQLYERFWNGRFDSSNGLLRRRQGGGMRRPAKSPIPLKETSNDRPTTDAYGELIEPATRTLQRLLPGPIERVWSYLTDSDLAPAMARARAIAYAGRRQGRTGLA